MLYYIYDGSFEGLLTCIYEAFYRHEAPGGIFPEKHYQQTLTDSTVYIETDTIKSDKVAASIKKKISCQAYEHVFLLFLSELEHSGLWVYEYLKLGFKVGREVEHYLADERVMRTVKAVQKVTAEKHRLLGLIRFKLLHNGIYYAAITSDHNVLTLLAPHFAERFADQPWVIHDLRRYTAALYNKTQWIVTDFYQEKLQKSFDAEEDLFQTLWKQYFKDIAIKARTNPRLQRQYMPRRYWQHLVEME